MVSPRRRVKDVNNGVVLILPVKNKARTRNSPIRPRAVRDALYPQNPEISQEFPDFPDFELRTPEWPKSPEFGILRLHKVWNAPELPKSKPRR